jgi:cob(I)alamin adenosyltransferase
MNKDAFGQVTMNKDLNGPRLAEGITQIYFGEGKGKTTAAIGQAIRALGQGLRIYMAQFLKPMKAFSGEMAMFEKMGPHFIFRRPNKSCFLDHVLTSDEKDQEKAFITDEIVAARKMILSGSCDIFIFDELLTALQMGLIEESYIEDLLKIRPKQIEIILTGLQSTQKLTDLADLVTEMKIIKHPFQTGLKARRGIEY